MRVVFCGIAKNNSDTIDSTMHNINRLISLFDEYKIVIYENDSSDNTLEKLKKIRDTNVIILSEKLNAPVERDLKIMAYARNQYLNYIIKHYIDYDLMIVLDMDFKKEWDIKGIKDSLNKIDMWNGVCSNGVFTEEDNRMYDAFAYLDQEYQMDSIGAKQYLKFKVLTQII